MIITAVRKGSIDGYQYSVVKRMPFAVGIINSNNRISYIQGFYIYCILYLQLEC